LRSQSRRLSALVAVAVAVALVGGACSKKTDTTADTGAGTSVGSVPAGATVDYSTLTGTLNGSGSTFQKAFDEEVIDALKTPAPNLTVNYAGGGSGKGKQDLADQVVDFAGSDSTEKPEDLTKNKGGGILYFPTVAGPITVSYNLQGVSKLQLSGPTVAKIFSTTVKTWNDPAIAADNPGVTLPSTAIVVVHRSDGSGTTSNFTKFLKSAGGSDWTLDSGDTVNWASGTQAGNGNAGVAQTVKSTDGAIGYVDYSDAKASSLQFAAVKNKAGSFVAPSLEGATAAVAGATIKPDLTYDPINADGATVYPITSPTWIIVYQKQPDAAKGNNLKGFLNFTLTQGQPLAAGVDFAALPASLQQQAVAQLSQLQIG
jgi:phosphate transport system substrate-binding protein